MLTLSNSSLVLTSSFHCIGGSFGGTCYRIHHPLYHLSSFSRSQIPIVEPVTPVSYIAPALISCKYHDTQTLPWFEGRTFCSVPRLIVAHGFLFFFRRLTAASVRTPASCIKFLSTFSSCSTSGYSSSRVL